MLTRTCVCSKVVLNLEIEVKVMRLNLEIETKVKIQIWSRKGGDQMCEEILQTLVGFSDLKLEDQFNGEI